MNRAIVPETQAMANPPKTKRILPARNPFVGDSILGMDAIAWLILVVIVLVVAAVAFVVIRRRRRGGGVIATKGKK
jgi:hypothetical protein